MEKASSINIHWSCCPAPESGGGGQDVQNILVKYPKLELKECIKHQSWSSPPTEMLPSKES